MTDNTKNKIKFLCACIFSGLLLLGSVLLIGVSAEAVLLEEKDLAAQGLFTAVFAFFVVSGALFFGIGMLSMGALSAFFAHSLLPHETKAIGKTAKILFAGDIVLMSFDLLAMLILLL